MKILCEYTPSGPHYVRSGWGHAFKAAKHDFRFWVPETKSIMDAFNEFEPDIFLGTTYGVDRALSKCIAARPNLKVGLFASAWGPAVEDVDKDKYPIVVVTEQERETIARLKDTTGKPDFVFIHVTQKYLGPTMGGWRSIGVEPLGILNAADIVKYHPAPPMDEFTCDVAFVGGYWGYKSRNINDFLLPLCHPSQGINVKVFGNKPWPVHSFLGKIEDDGVKHLFNSALVCPNVSEPHSTDLGWDIIERPFKVLSSGGFCISDHVDEMSEVFDPSELITARSREEFMDLVGYYITNPEERASYIERGCRKVVRSHTYFDRVTQMLNGFGLPEEASRMMEAKGGVVNAIYSHLVEPAAAATGDSSSEDSSVQVPAGDSASP